MGAGKKSVKKLLDFDLYYNKVVSANKPVAAKKNRGSRPVITVPASMMARNLRYTDIGMELKDPLQSTR